MPREWNLDLRCKDANVGSVIELARGKHEGGLGIIEFSGDRLHLGWRKAFCIQNYRQWVAAEWSFREDIDGYVSSIHKSVPFALDLIT
jgi:hypothetical protein